MARKKGTGRKIDLGRYVQDNFSVEAAHKRMFGGGGNNWTRNTHKRTVGGLNPGGYRNIQKRRKQSGSDF